MADQLSRTEITKDAVQHTVEAGAETVASVAMIVTGAVRDITHALGGFATEGFEIRDAARRARAENEEYFRTRPRESQVGAWASRQSRPLGSRAELDALVDEELRRTYRHPTLRNELGDVAIRVGSTMVFLRSTPDGAELVLFSALVHEVTGRSRACEVLNDLNVESRYGRFALHRDRVFVQLSVAAQPFVPAHLHQALSALSQIADGIDDELATKLGGRTTF